MKPGFDHNRVEQLLADLSCTRLTRVCDIGANPISAPAYQPLLEMGGCEVWGFEPQQAAFDALTEKAGPHEHYLPDAVGSGGRDTLKICEASGFTSLLEANPKALGYMGWFKHAMTIVDRIEVETQRLDDIEELPQFDLLKIDIQGGEKAVFDNGMQKLSGAVAVISEVAAIPLYQGQPLLDDQMRGLRGAGYHLHKFLTFKRVKVRSRQSRAIKAPFMRGQLLDGDAVFVRQLLDLPEASDEHLKHLTILADTVFESYDLALHALNLLVQRGSVAAAALDRYAEYLAPTKVA